MPPERKGTAGFSLAEALVALAVTAFLAGILTRFVSHTRATASSIRQEVTMGILGDDLIERLGAGGAQPGRTQGRTGALRWRIDTTPIAFSVHALSISEKEPDQPKAGQPAGLGLPPISMSTSSEPAPKAKAPRISWAPYRVTVTITAPSGRRYETETIRIGQQRATQASVDAAQP